MEKPILVSAFAVLVFALVHVFGGRLAFLSGTPRSVWLSLAGGGSVAYVFVHLLPELAEHQDSFGRQTGGLLGALERQTYLIALFGLALFYGVEHLARNSARTGSDRAAPLPVFWTHLGSFALYNLLIGYLLLHREQADLRGLIIYAFAMALHFIVNDNELRSHHGRLYDHVGRWLLAAAPAIGWALAIVTSIPQLAVTALFAFLAGGIVLNVLKGELPEERESRFWAFAAGALAYALLLLGTA